MFEADNKMIPILKYKIDDTSRVFGRTQLDDGQHIAVVNAIISDVRSRKDEALFEYAKKFDGQDLDRCGILVSDDEIKDAYSKVDKSLIDGIRRAKENILAYHLRQTDKFKNEFFTSGASGTSTLGWIYRPLARVGLYVPGGKASYPSTVLMTALPAIAAGVGEVIVATPNIKNPAILVACRE